MKETLKQKLNRERERRSDYCEWAERAEEIAERAHALWVRADDRVERLEAALRRVARRAAPPPETGNGPG